MGLDELLKGIAEENPDPAEFASSLQGVFQPGYQAIFDRGHKTATSEAKKKIADANKVVADKDAEIAKLNERIEEAGKGHEGVTKIREDYKRELADKDAKHKAELEALTGQLARERTDRVVSDLRRSLEAAGMFEVHADALANKVRDRIRHRDDGSFEILKEAGSDVAIQPQDGKPTTALGLLAKEIASGAPKAMFASKVSGRGAGGKAGDDGGAGSGTRFDKIREDAKARRESGTPDLTKGGGLLDRMGVAKPA